MNKKESVNYNVENTVVISRSPVFKKSTVRPLSSAVIRAIHPVNSTLNKTLRNSFVENIDSVNRVLDESNRILPYRK
ncbi:hypothetical protein [Sutcliffiella horikoshii]|uniref:hypothetical protein n=1 Tax=Sutcliffiella horikoshii TaxID=79883 RepID=UPI001CBABBD4|nr:hypothetical protein [Sutcliffiella horikoshii]UAL48061.1 hypothetical protein K7887_03595 [Sutcliffiella horikoshii]